MVGDYMAYWHELYTEETDKQSRYNVIQIEGSFCIQGTRKLACHSCHTITT